MTSTVSNPIAVNMLFVDKFRSDYEADGQASLRTWERQLARVTSLGAHEIDPTDAWVPLTSIDDGQLQAFQELLARHGVTVPSVSAARRRSVVDKDHGSEYLADTHRLIEVSAALGAAVVNIGFMQKLTPAQEKATWFWLEPGHVDDPALRDLAIDRVRELADHAASLGMQLSLEMYEDTYVGTPEEAVDFIRDVDHAAVGLNPDLGNLIRLHRPQPDPVTMHELVLPYTNFWHIKNYTRDYDPVTGVYSSAPAPLRYGYVNYRYLIPRALELGFTGPFCCENYGSDSVGIMLENRDYIATILGGYTP